MAKLSELLKSPKTKLVLAAVVAVLSAAAAFAPEESSAFLRDLASLLSG